MGTGIRKTVIIESKASGLPLTYELRKLGIPVINFSPSKGNDKTYEGKQRFAVV
jgi:hypothetical protein